MSFVASFTLLYGPLVFFRVVFVLLLFLAITHDDTQDVIVHLISQSWQRSHFSVFFVCFGLVVVVCFWFAWFLLFLVVFFWFLAGTARWTAYRSTTSTFVAIDK